MKSAIQVFETKTAFALAILKEIRVISDNINKLFLSLETRKKLSKNKHKYRKKEHCKLVLDRNEIKILCEYI